MNEALNGLARKNAIGAFVALMIRAVVVAFGLVLMVISVPIGMLTPLLPIGFPIGLFGLVLVAAASKTLHRLITDQLRRVPWLWKRIRFAFGEKEADPAE